MGCDIHWILERQAADGAWHAVMDKGLAYDRFDAAGPYADLDARISARRADPLMRIGQRDYTLFGWLSKVRGPILPRGHLALPDFPLDASAYARQEARILGDDWHSHGWLPPETLTAPSPACVHRRLDERSYAAFARLSGVRGAPDAAGPVATLGLPEPLSDWSRALVQDVAWRDNHTSGHLGQDALPRLAHPDTRRFAEALRLLLASPLAALPLPAMVLDDGGWRMFADLSGAESAHARLSREARGAGLLPPDAQDAWRLLISYDN